MTKVQNLIDRLHDGYRDKSIIKDLKQEGVSFVFSEESKCKLKEMDNIELDEHSETVRTTQCPTCLKYSKEGTIYCGCPSLEQTEKIKNRIDILAGPLYVVKRCKAGERHGPEEWPYHHWKAASAGRNCRKREYESVAKRWIEDPDYRVTQQIHGWTLEYCMFLDCLKTIKINYKATRGERD